MSQKRIEWIDQLKGITFFLVVLGHTDGILDWGIAHPYIYSFHMPLFLMMTGFTLNIDKVYNTSFVDYVTKLFKRMIVPYVWLNLICMPLRYILYNFLRGSQMKVIDFLKGIVLANTAFDNALSPATPTYYIILLFFAQLLLFALIKLTKKNNLILFPVSLLLLVIPLATIKTPVIWHLNVVPVAMMFIILGRILMDMYLKNKQRLDNTNIWKLIPVCVLLVIGGFIFYKLNGKISIHLNLYGNNFILFILSALLTSTALVILVSRMPKIGFINYIGKNTLFSLGIHAAIISIVEQLFKNVKSELWFIFIEAIAIYLMLIPMIYLVNKFAPFLNGNTTKDNSPLSLICRYLCVFAAGCVPVLFFLQKFRGGVLLSSTGMKISSVIGYLVLCAVVTVMFEKVFPFMFIKEKRK